jgi:hypothetical protein
VPKSLAWTRPSRNDIADAIDHHARKHGLSALASHQPQLRRPADLAKADQAHRRRRAQWKARPDSVARRTRIAAQRDIACAASRPTSITRAMGARYSPRTSRSDAFNRVQTFRVGLGKSRAHVVVGTLTLFGFTASACRLARALPGLELQRRCTSGEAWRFLSRSFLRYGFNPLISSPNCRSLNSR